jgi:hypothetical protein
MYVVSQGLAFSVSDSFEHLWHLNRSVQTSESIMSYMPNPEEYVKDFLQYAIWFHAIWSLASITSNFWYGLWPSFYMLKLCSNDNIGSTKNEILVVAKAWVNWPQLSVPLRTRFFLTNLCDPELCPRFFKHFDGASGRWCPTHTRCVQAGNMTSDFSLFLSGQFAP